MNFKGSIKQKSEIFSVFLSNWVAANEAALESTYSLGKGDIY